eukprot:c14927_g1_i2.p2 GENE.c14927_g1_i2~~c14927_g1_i2.p2  ORF type:complete len:344 (-),score=68.53 c14927_g1_i2:74-1105(-)
MPRHNRAAVADCLHVTSHVPEHDRTIAGRYAHSLTLRRDILCVLTDGFQHGVEFLVYGGKTGWIGGKLIEMLTAAGRSAVAAEARIEDLAAVGTELDTLRPKYVLNCAGLTGRPNVDWCEFHKDAVLRVNVAGALLLADATAARSIPCVFYATGCIYSYDEAHPIGGPGFTEEDPANFDGSFYSLTKGIVESLLRSNYSNLLILRLRMPISDDLHSRSFVTKITKYAKVVDVPNSMTVLTDLLPVSIQMCERGLRGVFNFVNPGAISHNEILTLYKEIIDPDFTWSNFTVAECDAILACKRSNNTLSTAKISKEFPDIPEIHVAMRRCFERMRDAGVKPTPRA